MTTKYCIIYTSTDKEEVASSIAFQLISSKLAACVQTHKVMSTFEWEGKICTAQEFRISIKTIRDNYQQVELLIHRMHNYKLPEMIMVDIMGGSKSYLDWIQDSSTYKGK